MPCLDWVAVEGRDHHADAERIFSIPLHRATRARTPFHPSPPARSVRGREAHPERTPRQPEDPSSLFPPLISHQEARSWLADARNEAAHKLLAPALRR